MAGWYVISGNKTISAQAGAGTGAELGNKLGLSWAKLSIAGISNAK